MRILQKHVLERLSQKTGAGENITKTGACEIINKDRQL